MKKRVVIFSAFLTPFRSGAEACAEEVALRLSDRYNITIVTAKLRHDLPRNDLLGGRVPILRVGFGAPFDKWIYPLLAPLTARRLKPEIVHAVLETFAGFALMLCRWIVPGAKKLLTLQTTNRNFLKKKLMRSADQVTAISSVLIEEAKRNGVVADWIPNGIDFHLYEKIRSKYQKIPGRILYVGRLEKVKGVDILLRAFAKVTDPNAHLRIIGNGSQYHALIKIAHELCIADRVTFAGYIPHEKIIEEHARARIFCGLSRSEALGNVFIEAMAACCIVIASKVGGIKDVIQDGINGLLVSPDNPSEVSDLINKILAQPGSFEPMARNAGQSADRFDWHDRIVPEYGRIYERLIARATDAAR